MGARIYCTTFCPKNDKLHFFKKSYSNKSINSLPTTEEGNEALIILTIVQIHEVEMVLCNFNNFKIDGVVGFYSLIRSLEFEFLDC